MCLIPSLYTITALLFSLKFRGWGGGGDRDRWVFVVVCDLSEKRLNISHKWRGILVFYWFTGSFSDDMLSDCKSVHIGVTEQSLGMGKWYLKVGKVSGQKWSLNGNGWEFGSKSPGGSTKPVVLASLTLLWWMSLHSFFVLHLQCPCFAVQVPVSACSLALIDT